MSVRFSLSFAPPRGLLSLILCCGFATFIPLSSFNAAAATDIYLFRHAEKQADGTPNPSLTQAGEQRAKWLANYLKAQNIQQIYSTDYHRTQQTVAPLARQTGLKVVVYDPRKLIQFANKLKQTPGVLVVVGHSNTIPQLVTLLGGDAGEEMAESEFDRVYQIHIEKTHKTQTRRFNSSMKADSTNDAG
jgi:broad specificity phosphatase PhoE